MSVRMRAQACGARVTYAPVVKRQADTPVDKSKRH